MKLTESQINIICHYTDGYRIDREKLISYLEKHRTIKSDVGKRTCVACLITIK